MICPSCGSRQLANTVVARLHTTFEGVQIIVPNAAMRKCPACGEVVYSARELKRWRAIKQGQQVRSYSPPTGNEVRMLRDIYGVTATKFAAMMAVTRQTVHAWERCADKPMKLCPAAILIRLLLEQAMGEQS